MLARWCPPPPATLRGVCTQFSWVVVLLEHVTSVILPRSRSLLCDMLSMTQRNLSACEAKPVNFRGFEVGKMCLVELFAGKILFEEDGGGLFINKDCFILAGVKCEVFF